VTDPSLGADTGTDGLIDNGPAETEVEVESAENDDGIGKSEIIVAGTEKGSGWSERPKVGPVCVGWP